MKIRVAPLVYGGWEPDAAHACFRFLQYAAGQGVRTEYAPHGNDALVERARSVVATRFLEQSDADVLLHLDHDIVAHPEDLLTLCQQAMTHSIVAAPYVTRGKGMHPRPSVTSWLAQGVPVDFAGEDRVEAVKWVATGCLAVHRRVYETLRANPAHDPALVLCHPKSAGFRMVPFYLPFITQDEDGDPILLSEDFAFSERAARAGFPSYLNPAIRVLHLGQYPFSVDDLAAEIPSGVPVRVTRTDARNLRIETFTPAAALSDDPAAEAPHQELIAA